MALQERSITRCRFAPSRYEAIVVTIVMAIAFLSYALVWRQAPLLSPDSPSYMRLARQIKAGNITELSLRTPGFPLFLILTGSEVTPGRALYYVALLLHFFVVGLLAWLLRLLGIDRRLVMCMIGIALLPPYVEPSAYADSENLCQFLVVVAAVCAVLWRFTERRSLLWGFGLAALGAGLVRPTYQFLVVAIGLAIVLGCVAGIGRTEPVLKLVGTLARPVLLVAGVLGGYAAFNGMKFGYFDTSGMTAITLSHKTATFIECLPDSYAQIRSTLLKYRDREILMPFSDHTGQNYVHRALPEVIELSGNDRAKAFRALKTADLYLITHKPVSYLIEALKAGVTYWMPEDGDLSGDGSGKWRALWAVMQMAIVGVFITLAVALTGLAAVFFGARMRTQGQLAISPQTREQITTYGIGMATVLYSAAISCFAGMGLPRFRETSDLIILACCFVGASLFIRSADFIADSLRYRMARPAC
jgi:hypothetical protein